MRTVVLAALCALPFATHSVLAQDTPKTAPATSPYQSVVGTVESENLAQKSFTVKPDKTESTTIKFDDRTAFLRIPAGETDLKKATKAAAGDVGVGDRILARVWTDSPTGKPAITFIITKQSDLAQRQQKTLEEWQTQSVMGIVSAVDPASKKITMKVRAGNAPPKDVTVDVSGKVNYEHFSPDTGKYQPSDGTDIASGDQLRVIGEKNSDVTSVKADAVQSGAFKSIPAQIKTIDANGMQISAIDPSTKKAVTISVKPFTSMKRLDDQSALMLARRLNPNFQQGRGGGRGGPGGNAGPGAAGGAAAAGGGGRGGPGGAGAPGGMAAGGGRGFGGGGGRGMDPARIIEQQQTIQIADLKAGEPLIVTGVVSGDPSRITAITLIAGVDPILRASPNNGADPLGGGWNFGGEGGGGGGGGAQ